MKKSTSFTKFISYLGTDIRKYEVICSLLPICLFPYFLLVHPISNSQFMTIGFPIFFFLILLLGIIKRLRGRLGNDCKDCSTSELFEIAKKLDPELIENPFLVTEKKDFVAETRRPKIILGKDYLEKLISSAEKTFVIGHELFHYRGKAESYVFLPIIAVLILLFGLMISLKIDVVSITSFGGLLYLLRVFSERSLESMADCQGAQLSGKEAAMKALEIRYKSKKTTIFDFHPRLEIRKKNIENECSKTYHSA